MSCHREPLLTRQNLRLTTPGQRALPPRCWGAGGDRGDRCRASTLWEVWFYCEVNCMNIVTKEKEKSSRNRHDLICFKSNGRSLGSLVCWSLLVTPPCHHFQPVSVSSFYFSNKLAYFTIYWSFNCFALIYFNHPQMQLVLIYQNENKQTRKQPKTPSLPPQVWCPALGGAGEQEHRLKHADKTAAESLSLIMCRLVSRLSY